MTLKDYLVNKLGGFTKDDVKIIVEENLRTHDGVVWKSVKNHGMPKTSHNQIALWNGKWPRFGKCLGLTKGAEMYGQGKSFYTPFDEPLKGITHYAILPLMKDVDSEE